MPADRGAAAAVEAEGVPTDVDGVVRHFVMQAPPGQLQAILKSLHTVCGGGDDFFAAIPDVAFEYTVQHNLAIPARLADGGLPPGAAVLCSSDSHFASSVKRLAKSAGVKGDVAAQPFLAYFDAARGEPTAAASAQSKDTDDDEKEATFFERLDFVFLDYRHQRYVEIDPVEGVVVRSLCFATSTAAATRTDGEWSNSEQFPFMEALERATPFVADVGGDVAPPARNGIAVAALHRGLVAELENYVTSNFAVEVWWQQGPQAMVGLGRGAGSTTQPRGADATRTPQIVCSSHVALDPTTGDLVLLYTSERSVAFTSSSRWGARWAARYVLACSAPDHGGAVVLRGVVRVSGHFLEDATVHVEVDERLEDLELTLNTDDVGASCKTVIKAMRRRDRELQRKLEAASKEVGESALKGLRRRLPITKQLFDFSKAAQQLPSFCDL